MEPKLERSHELLEQENAATGSSMKIRFYPLVVQSSGRLPLL